MKRTLSRQLLPVCALALPLLVWYLGTFYFHGHLGKWLDDYGAHLRDPATGAIHWNQMVRPVWWFFWRPIHIQLIYVLQTLFYEHDWANHLFSALMHAMACHAMWRFLKECGVRPAVSAAGALMLLGSAQGYEAIFWPATVSTSIATAGFLWAGVFAIRHARGERPGLSVALLAALGFVIPCLYEQPAAALGALPIVYVAASRGRMWAPGWRQTLSGMVIALGPSALMLGVYLALFYFSVRNDGTSRENAFSDPGLMHGHLEYLLGTMPWFMRPWDGFGEMRQAALENLRTSAIGIYGWAALAGAAGGAWVWYWWNCSDVRDSNARAHAVSGRVRSLVLAPFGLTALLFSLVPILSIRGAGISTRLVYFPTACGVIVVVGLVDAGVRALGRRGRLGVTMVAGTSAVLALIGAVQLAGVQHFMRQRYSADQAVLRSLHAAAPNPALETVFVPVRWEHDPSGPHERRVGGSFQPIWMSPWAMNSEIKRVYGRNDVEGAGSYSPRDIGAFVLVGDPSTIAWSHLFRNLPTPRMDAESYSVPASKVVPYCIDAMGNVTLVSELHSRTPDGRALHVEFPQVPALLRPGATAESLMIKAPFDGRWTLISKWRWAHRRPPLPPEVEFRRFVSWGTSATAAFMHPQVRDETITDGDTDEMVALVPAAAGKTAHRLIFRVTFDESVIGLNMKGDGVEIAWTLDNSVLMSLRLKPREVKARRAWETVSIDIPPSSTDRTLRILVGPGPDGNASYDRVVVSCGEEDLRATGATMTATGENVSAP